MQGTFGEPTVWGKSFITDRFCWKDASKAAWVSEPDMLGSGPGEGGSGSCQGVTSKSAGSQEAFRKSGSCQEASISHQKDIRKPSGSYEAIRKVWKSGSHQEGKAV